MAAVYDMLRAFPPFTRMKLPPSEEVEFHVTRSLMEEGFYKRSWRKNDHQIHVSQRRIETFDRLNQAMAHEMIHLYLGIHKLDNKGGMHGGLFQKYARAVCTVFNWDFKVFIQ